jgi:mRNA interferase MazF
VVADTRRKRGQIWWARVDKRRPVLLVSREEAYEVRRRVVAAEVTTMIRHNPATVELGRRDGMPEVCIVNCDNLVTVNQDDLVDYLTTLAASHGAGRALASVRTRARLRNCGGTVSPVRLSCPGRRLLSQHRCRQSEFWP